ncbi:MAG: hypothetical protein H7A01_01665 [Hahellaceae bacterium]|jgi:hypothetical protein|nr:hypothetical protein [Hahellaceae bacterium]MCP5212648.1 hypothetical protein [Hahellaceae bacterium]
MKTPHIISALALLTLFSTTSYAQPPQEQGRRGAPPQEAIDACEGQEVDVAVSFVTPRGDTLNATCKLINGQLVAVPANHKGKPKD